MIKKKILVVIVCVAFLLSGCSPRLVGEAKAKEAGLAFINHVFDVNETDAVVSYQEQTGTTFTDGTYKVTGEEQPVYVYIVAAAKQEDGQYLYYTHVNAETGVAYAAFRNTMFAPELTADEQKALEEARKSGNNKDDVYTRISTECENAAQKWIPEKFELKAGILGFLDGGGSLGSTGGNANFYVVVRDGTIYHVTFSWPQLTVMDVTLLNQTRPTEDMR